MASQSSRLIAMSSASNTNADVRRKICDLAKNMNKIENQRLPPWFIWHTERITQLVWHINEFEVNRFVKNLSLETFSHIIEITQLVWHINLFPIWTSFWCSSSLQKYGQKRLYMSEHYHNILEPTFPSESIRDVSFSQVTMKLSIVAMRRTTTRRRHCVQ